MRTQHTPRPAGWSPLVIILRYLRLSSEEQRKRGLAIETQDGLIDRYIARVEEPCIVGERFADIMPGTRDDRPDWRRLLKVADELVAAGNPVWIVSMRIDRLGRDEYELQGTWRETQRLGIAIHTVDHGWIRDATMFGMYAVFSAHEVRLLSEKIVNRHEKVREGRWRTHGRPPFGYRWDDATDDERAAGAPRRVLRIDPETTETVRAIYRRLLAGESLHAVARWTAALPASERAGKRLAYNGVSLLVRSPVYVARPGRAGDRSAEVLARPVQQWEPLVSDAEWRRVQDVLDDHQRHPRQASGRYLLTGYLVCPKCGSGVTGARVPRHEGGVYQCKSLAHTSVSRCFWRGWVPKFDGPVRAQLTAVLQAIVDGPPRAVLERAWEARQQPVPGSSEDQRRKRLGTMRREVEATLSRATRKWADDQIDYPAYQALAAELRGELEALDAELGQLEAARGPRAPVRLVGEYLDLATEFAPLVESAPVAKLRPVLALCLARVEAVRTGHGRYDVSAVWTKPLADLLELIEHG